MKCEAMQANSSRFSVRKMCKALGLTESVYYRWARMEQRRKEKREAEKELVKTVVSVFHESLETYGCRRLKRTMRDEKNIDISEWKVRRIMKENGLYPETIMKYKPYRNGKTNCQYSENLVKQNFLVYVYAPNGNLSSETDKTGKTTSYTYDAYGHVTSKSFDIYTVYYTPNGDISSVIMGTQTLATYTYDNDGNLTSTAYANGQTINYVYGIDSDSNETKGVYYDNETTPRYFYTYYSDGRYVLTDNVNSTKASYYPVENSGGSWDGYYIYIDSVINGYITRTRSYVYANGTNAEEGITDIAENLGNKQYITAYGDETAVENLAINYSGELAKLKMAVGSDFNKIDEFLLENDWQVLLGVFYTLDENGNTTGIKVGLVNYYSNTDTFDITVLNSISYGYTNNKVTTETHTFNNSTITINYSYDSNGNITSVTNNGLATYYHYDSNSQLVRVDDGEQNKTISYTYDSRGNILTKSEYAYTTATDLTGLTPTSTICYTYGNSAWADELTSYNGNAISYDALGNRISYNGWTYTWEGGRLLTSMTNIDGTTITYTYDVDGIRTSKTVNGVTTYYTTIDGKITSQTDGTNSLYFTYDSNDNLFGVEINGTNYLYVTDYQGDIIAITDINGTIIVRYTYDAWGNVTSITGSLASTIGQLNPMRYRGYYYDSETGYYYLQSRYHEPAMGRFINSDEPSVLVLGKSYGNNMFAYCNNNSVNNEDKDGYAPYIGWGIQIEGSFFGLSGGIELIWYKSIAKSMYGKRNFPCIYLYGALSYNFKGSNIWNLKSTLNVLKDESLKAFSTKGKALWTLGGSFSICAFRVYGTIKNPKQYMGPFFTTTATAFHVKAYYSRSPKGDVYTIGLGFSTSKFGFSPISASYYYLIPANFVITIANMFSSLVGPAQSQAMKA